ncbi:MAG: prepilin-type N-terminal cleavage/methylation domain-containing protein [Deltaproteobacteria bacterium]|nr:prepilin-type N-terminal cleavage/methylation domain-containing protein [Deltaproteobacteria bacterium]
MQPQNGLSLIEVLAALTLMSLVIMGALVFQTQTLQGLNERRLKTRADLERLAWRAEEFTEGRCSKITTKHGLVLMKCEKQGRDLGITFSVKRE